MKHDAVHYIILSGEGQSHCNSPLTLRHAVQLSNTYTDLSFDLYLIAIVRVRRKTVNAKDSWRRGHVFDLKQACIIPAYENMCADI